MNLKLWKSFSDIKERKLHIFDQVTRKSQSFVAKCKKISAAGTNLGKIKHHQASNNLVLQTLIELFKQQAQK